MDDSGADDQPGVAQRYKTGQLKYRHSYAAVAAREPPSKMEEVSNHRAYKAWQGRHGIQKAQKGNVPPPKASRIRRRRNWKRSLLGRTRRQSQVTLSTIDLRSCQALTCPMVSSYFTCIVPLQMIYYDLKRIYWGKHSNPRYLNCVDESSLTYDI